MSRCRPSVALLATWTDQAEVKAIRTILEEKFGYEGTHLLLPQEDPDQALISQIQSLLVDTELSPNPFIVYYRGLGYIKDRRPLWRKDSNRNTAHVDWFSIQPLLETCKANVILIIDCDYGVIPTMNKDGEGSSVFHRVSTQQIGGSRGKFEIIAAPQRAQDSQQSFSQALAEALERQQPSSPLELRDLREVLSETLRIEYTDLPHYSSGGKIELIPVGPRLGQNNSPSTAQSVRDHDETPGMQEKEEAEIVGRVREWNGYAQWSKILPAREVCQDNCRVVVLPIIWEKSDWQANQETEALRTKFKTHFNYEVKDTFIIPDTPDPQGLLKEEIDSYIGISQKTSTKALSAGDLLIILYNGHGSNGHKNGWNMNWTCGYERVDPKPTYRPRINWTEIVKYLDRAPCNVLQILDCCYAATAVKGEAQDEQKLDHEPYQAIYAEKNGNNAVFNLISKDTSETEYLGRNEILASTGRDNPTVSGRHASMYLFAEVLDELARQRAPFSVYSWFHEVDRQVVSKNSQYHRNNRHEERDDKPVQRDWYYTPFWKLHPKETWPRSIVLRPRAIESPLNQSSSKTEYVYAKIKVENGRPTGVESYATAEQMRSEFAGRS